MAVILFIPGMTAEADPTQEWLKAIRQIVGKEHTVEAFNYHPVLNRGWRAKLRLLIAALIIPLPPLVRKFLGRKIGDVFDVYFYRDTRNSVTSWLINALRKATADPKEEVHVISHSLGTVLTALVFHKCPTEVCSITLLGSPFSSIVKTIGSVTRRLFSWELLQLRRNSGYAEVNYVYGTRDPISGPLRDPFGKAVDRQAQLTCGHSDIPELLTGAFAPGTQLYKLRKRDDD